MCFAVEFCLFVARARVAFVIERDVFVCVIAGRAVRDFRVCWCSWGITYTLSCLGRRNLRLVTQRVTSEAGAGKALFRGLTRISLVTRVRTPKPPSVCVKDVSASLWKRHNPYADLEAKLVIGSPH